MAKHETNDHAMKTMCEQQQQPEIHPSSLLSVCFVCMCLILLVCLQQPQPQQPQTKT